MKNTRGPEAAYPAAWLFSADPKDANFLQTPRTQTKGTDIDQPRNLAKSVTGTSIFDCFRDHGAASFT